MARELAVALLFNAALFIATSHAADSILTCTFTAGTASFFADGAKPIEAELDKKEAAWTIVFAGLTTDTPIFKGNRGEERLVILKRTPDTMWLGEVPPL